MTLSIISPTYQFAVISGLAWAITTIVAKQYLLKSFDPMEMYILRMGLGFPILALLILIILNNSQSTSSDNNKNTTQLPTAMHRFTSEYFGYHHGQNSTTPQAFGTNINTPKLNSPIEPASSKL